MHVMGKYLIYVLLIWMYQDALYNFPIFFTTILPEHFPQNPHIINVFVFSLFEQKRETINRPVRHSLIFIDVLLRNDPFSVYQI